MFDRRIVRSVARLGLIGGIAALMLVRVGAPAWAHVEVSAEPAQAGASNATVTFDLAAESQTAGITGVKVQLPAGIAPSQVRLASAPEGWALTATSDGYEVSGPPSPVGEDVSYSIQVDQLPVESVVLFKTLQNYSDGRQDAWIEEPSPQGSDPENPAPALTLAPAAASPSATTDSPSPSGTEQSTPAQSQPAADGDNNDDEGIPAVVWVGLVAVLLIAAAVGRWIMRRHH